MNTVLTPSAFQPAASREITSSNFWKFADLIEGYGVFTLMGTAFITSVLSIAGIAGGINIMVWTLGVMLGGAIVGLLRFLAYDQEHSNKDDATKFSSAVFATVKKDALFATLGGSRKDSAARMESQELALRLVNDAEPRGAAGLEGRLGGRG